MVMYDYRVCTVDFSMRVTKITSVRVRDIVMRIQDKS